MSKYTKFGYIVRCKMLKEGIKVQELAEWVGISRQYLTDILRGARESAQYEAKIAEVLRIKAG